MIADLSPLSETPATILAPIGYARPLLSHIRDHVPTIAIALEADLVDAAFEVVLVHNGAQGVAELEKDADRCSCVVTDIRLPDVDGWALGMRARELVADMPMVYMSGDSAWNWSSQGVPGSIMLKKPFLMSQFTAAVSQVMNARHRTQGGDHTDSCG